MRAGTQRDSTMRENCREKDESSRYRQQFGMKVMLILSEPLPTLSRRWRLLSLLIYFTWQRRQNWGSMQSSCKPFLLEEPFHSSVDWLANFNFFSTFCLSHGDYPRQKVEISVQGLSLTTSNLISFKTFDESIRTMWFITMGLKRIGDEFPALSDTFSQWKDKSGDRSDRDK